MTSTKSSEIDFDTESRAKMAHHICPSMQLDYPFSIFPECQTRMGYMAPPHINFLTSKLKIDTGLEKDRGYESFWKLTPEIHIFIENIFCDSWNSFKIKKTLIIGS